MLVPGRRAGAGLGTFYFYGLSRPDDPLAQTISKTIVLGEETSTLPPSRFDLSAPEKLFMEAMRKLQKGPK